MSGPRTLSESFASLSDPERSKDEPEPVATGWSGSKPGSRDTGYVNRPNFCSGAIVYVGGKRDLLKCTADAEPKARLCARCFGVEKRELQAELERRARLPR